MPRVVVARGFGGCAEESILKPIVLAACRSRGALALISALTLLDCGSENPIKPRYSELVGVWWKGQHTLIFWGDGAFYERGDDLLRTFAWPRPEDVSLADEYTGTWRIPRKGVLVMTYHEPDLAIGIGPEAWTLKYSVGSESLTLKACVEVTFLVGPECRSVTYLRQR